MEAAQVGSPRRIASGWMRFMSASVSSQLRPAMPLETACATMAAPEMATSVECVTELTRATASASLSWSHQSMRHPTGAMRIAAPFVSENFVTGAASSPRLQARSDAFEEGPSRLISKPFIERTHSSRSLARTSAGGTVFAARIALRITRAWAESSV